MAGISVDLKKIKLLNEDVLKSYLDIFGDNSISNVQEAELVTRQITSLLNDKSTRLLGMRLLQKVLNQFTAEMLESKAMLWTSLTLRDISSHEFPANVDVGFSVLGMIATRVHQLSELSKEIAINHIGNIVETCSNASPSNYLSSLICLEICLRLYPTYSGQLKDTAQKYVSKFIDMNDKRLTTQSGKCALLLQQVRSKNVNNFNLKTQWKNYQLNLLKSLQGIMDLINPNNVNVGTIYLEENESFARKLILSAEPLQRSIELFTRFNNLTNYFVIALSEPYPTEKPVMIKKVFDFIDAGLVTGFKMLQHSGILDNSLKILLPKIFLKLIQVFEALIKILKGHLRVYYHNVFEIFTSVLKLTRNEKENIASERYTPLRVKVYNIISDWCSMLGSGSRCEIIAHTLIEDIFKDVIPIQSETVLKVTSTSSKGKTAQQQRQKNDILNVNISKGQIELCIGALRCLQQILFSSSNFLKLNTLKAVQIHILNTCVRFYELPFKCNNIYSNWECRYEMYSVVSTMLVMSHPLHPPPTHMLFHILKNASSKDDSQKVRNYCGVILMNFEKIVHPQKESLAFTDLGDRNSQLLLHNESIQAREESFKTHSHIHKSTISENNLDLATAALINDDNNEIFKTNSDIHKSIVKENNFSVASQQIKKNKNMTHFESNVLMDSSLKSKLSEIPSANTTGVENDDQTIQNHCFISAQNRKLTEPVANDAKKIKLQNNDVSNNTYDSSVDERLIDADKQIDLMDIEDNCSLDSIEAAFVDELN